MLGLSVDDILAERARLDGIRSSVRVHDGHITVMRMKIPVALDLMLLQGNITTRNCRAAVFDGELFEYMEGGWMDAGVCGPQLNIVRIWHSFTVQRAKMFSK